MSTQTKQTTQKTTQKATTTPKTTTQKSTTTQKVTPKTTTTTTQKTTTPNTPKPTTTQPTQPTQQKKKKVDPNGEWTVVEKKSNYQHTNEKSEVVVEAKKPLYTVVPGQQKKNTMNSTKTEKKFNAGHNTQKKVNTIDRSMDAWDDDETQSFTLPTVPKETAQRIAQLRQVRNMNQAELAKLINEKVTVVNAYENGTAILNQNVISKIEKALGKKLSK